MLMKSLKLFKIFLIRIKTRLKMMKEVTIL